MELGLAILVIFCLLAPFLIIGGVVWLYVRSSQNEKKRVKSVEHWAIRNGWDLSRDTSLPFQDDLPGLRFRNRWVPLLLSSTVNGRPVAVADYTYMKTDTSGSETSSEVRDTTMVTAVRLPRSYPHVSVRLRRGGAFSEAIDKVFEPVGKVFKALNPMTYVEEKVYGPDPVRLQLGHPQFDEKFEVHSSDPEFARRLIGPMLVAEHVADRVPTWTVVGEDLFTWRGDGITDPEKIPTR